MSAQSVHQAYKNNSVSTASPGELTLMLYNGCLKFLGKAKIAVAEKNIQEKNTNLQKAQKIIQELMMTLNMDIEVSKSMMQMYEYMNHRLIEANMKNDTAIIEEVEAYVLDFRDTWKQVIQLNRQKQFTTGGQA
ncbi:flagellar export chaperone FliS [Psychrobacillus sp. FSL K6-2684]|uniref:Flagellar secretion chaperone FliS n=1 Tax=Psychrobacillus faecigallinarum TaxID=2762235 RepID=A0ABR8R5I5_9BACI|nr:MULTISPECIES: flagellar export chaperone FliS [Psychrobacillus]MBD7943028.1 flagellar export chaperone FliS [Psychrobacillus faecigallinarum]QEY20485.1 flagella export chaperone FliS [Psychrobacillus sp. AK 1817]QGM31021.1 flagellar export chaperone FliS [Bacillus sp. N3536]